MKKLAETLIQAGKEHALESKEKAAEAAKELGLDRQEILEELKDFEGYELEDEDLDRVNGGLASSAGSRGPRGKMTN